MNDIFPKDVFHAIVKRERAQADRNEREFALLVWDERARLGSDDEDDDEL